MDPKVSLSAAKSRTIMFAFGMCVCDASAFTHTHNCNWRAQSIEQWGVEKQRRKERRPNCSS